MKKKDDISLADKKAWENYIKDPKDVFDKELINKKKSLKRLKRFKFDLHGYTLDDANKKINEIIKQCSNDGINEILLITGKGLHSDTDNNAYVSRTFSKLKYSVPEYLQTNKELLEKIDSIAPADLSNGGEGAIIIRLKN